MTPCETDACDMIKRWQLKICRYVYCKCGPYTHCQSTLVKYPPSL